MTTRPQRPVIASLIAFLLGLAILVGLGYGFYWLLARILDHLSNITSDSGKAMVAAGTTIFGSVVTLVFGKAWEQRVKIQEEVRQRKLPVYEEQIKLLFSMMFSSREGSSPLTPQEIIRTHRAFTEKIIVWGGPGVIKAWTDFRLYNWTGDNPIGGFAKLEGLMKAIRTELGNSNMTLQEGDLLKLFINDFDEKKPGAASDGSTPLAPTEGVGEARATVETSKEPP